MTDDEIKALALKHCDNNIEFARALLAAHTANLLVRVEMPAQFGFVAFHTHGATTFSTSSTGIYFDTAMSVSAVYTKDQLQQYAAACAAQARVKALDEAKVVCVERMSFWRLSDDRYDEAESCAYAIGKLKGGE